MSALDDLRAARALIADPSRWTRGSLARNQDGFEVRAASDTAVCWCAYGALAKHGVEHDGAAADLLRRAGFDIFDRFVSTVNDTLGHNAVLRMYDRAIKLAGAQS